MKATEQYFPVMLFIMLYKVVLTFESVDEILKYESVDEILKYCRAVLSYDTLYFAFKQKLQHLILQMKSQSVARDGAILAYTVQSMWPRVRNPDVVSYVGQVCWDSLSLL